MGKRDEYKVNMKDEKTGRKSFTLANATSETDAKRQAERHHAAGNEHGNRAKIVTSVEKTGRSF